MRRDLDAMRYEVDRPARQSAIVEAYPLDRLRAHRLLNVALAAEILGVLRYRRHEIIARCTMHTRAAAEFGAHGDAAERHMMAIAQRIDELGGDPDFDPGTVATRAATGYVASTALGEMTAEDLVAHRVQIEVYRRMAPWFGAADRTTRALLEGILADEERRADELAALLATIDDA